MDLISIFRDFGFPIALCIALLWAVKAQNTQLVHSYTDRITTLENLVKSLTGKVDELESDRIKRADEYGHTLKSIAIAWATVNRESNELQRSSLAVLRRLCDSLQDYHPTPKTAMPTSREVPADPTKQETAQIHRKQA
jgi:hypothetical protein